MEIKEYSIILKKHKMLFWGVVVATIGIFLLWTAVRPVRYSTVLSLHVARTAGEQAETNAYQYDNFYRLEADEQFADTLVRWLQAPRIVLDIYSEAGIDVGNLSQAALSGVFGARRLSSQFVEVRYNTLDRESAGKIADAMEKILNEKTDELNAGSYAPNWFLVVVDEPVTELNSVRWKAALPTVVLVGIFLGFWGVMGRHYLSE